MTDKLPLPSGFIADFANWILNKVPTSYDWAVDCAVSTLSTTCSKMVIHDQYGKVKLNVFCLVIGPSRLGFKTVPLKDFVMPVLENFNEIAEIDCILPSRFSIEGLIKYMSQKPKDGNSNACSHKEGLILRDEFSSMFKDSKKGYLSDAMEFLSELYDGTLQKRFTISSGETVAKHVYVSLIGATTPYLFTIIERGFFVQGTGNRFVYDWVDESTVAENRDRVENGKSEKDNATSFFRDKACAEQDQNIPKFASIMNAIYNSKVEYLFPMDEAALIWWKYYHDKEAKASKLYSLNPHDLNYSYMGGMALNVLKYAGLATVSRASANIGKLQLDTLMINAEDMRWAIETIERRYLNFQKMIAEWGRTPVANQHQSSVLKSSKVDGKEIIRRSLNKRQGLFSVNWIKGDTGWTDTEKIGDVIENLVIKDWVELATGEEEKDGVIKTTKGNLTSAEYELFRPKAGFNPKVWRVTELGKQEYDKE